VTPPANGDWDSLDDDSNEGDMILVILVGIEDPVRPEVPDAIVACRKAGVTVRVCGPGSPN
jgi:magnesium-transporting ATPase (P-type)